MSSAVTFALGDPPPPAVRPKATTASRLRRHRPAGALALMLLATAAWGVLQAERVPAASASPDQAPATAWTHPGLQAPPAPAASAPGTGQPSALSLLLEGDRLVIDARRASREQAAQELAARTGGTLMAAPAAFEGAKPLDLQWRGRDAEQAWRAVLGPDSAHALQCEGLRCRVWLLATGPAPRRGQATDRPAAHASLQADPAGPFAAQ